jgi:hypothetical protein
MTRKFDGSLRAGWAGRFRLASGGAQRGRGWRDAAPSGISEGMQATGDAGA